MGRLRQNAALDRNGCIIRREEYPSIVAPLPVRENAFFSACSDLLYWQREAKIESALVAALTDRLKMPVMEKVALVKSLREEITARLRDEGLADIRRFIGKRYSNHS